jgi:hypothetical protein
MEPLLREIQEVLVDLELITLNGLEFIERYHLNKCLQRCESCHSKQSEEIIEPFAESKK